MTLPNLFDANDFKSFKLKITFKNLVSNTEIPSETLQLVQLGDKGLTLETPLRACARGHSVIISIYETELSSTPEIALLSATAKVREVDTSDDSKTQIVSLDLIQFEEENWNKLEALFSQRQNEILEFMKASKD